MKSSIRVRLVPVLFLCSALLFTALACGGSEEKPAVTEQAAEPTATYTVVPAAIDTIAPTSPPPTLPPTPTASTNVTPEAEEGDPDQAQDRLPCPDGATTYYLALTHHFWTDTGMGKWQWEAYGSVPLYLSEDNSLATDPLAFVPGRQYGAFSRGETSCQFEAPAEVSLSVSGSCQDGWLILDLWEDWSMGTYEWQCDDDAFQFEIPPMGSASHPDLKFPLTGGESYVDFPWLGGSGSKHWSLWTYEPEIETVPLTEP